MWKVFGRVHEVRIAVKLSIVTSLYRSSRYIEEFHRRVSSAARAIGEDSYEIIAVNDGSPDDSLEVARQIAEVDPHMIVVDLSRNFGHHKALMTGLSFAQGDLIFLIDVDLEEAPEWLEAFFTQLNNAKADVVYGVQKVRKGGRFERWSGAVFYLCFHTITSVDVPANMTTARLMTRRYVDALLKHDEREIYLAGLWHITGFVQIPSAVDKLSTSETTYTLRKKISLLINSVTSFSSAPLVGIFYFGALIFMIAAIYTSSIIFHKLFFGQTVAGWTSVMASVWLLGGLMISFIGIVGIYLSKVYSETKRRPYTIVRQVYGVRRNGV